MKRKALIAAFPHTIPIFAGFWFLGIAYGIYMHVSGFRFWYPLIMSMTIFGGKRPTPKYVQFLGDMLPGAVFSMLVVYCLRKVQFTGGTCGLPEISSIVLTVLLHLKFRKMLVSIAAGTVCYMVLVQMVF